MPTYDYGCERCGPFSASRPMAEFADPQPCPECGAAAPRVFLSAPALGGSMSSAEPAMPMAARAHPGGCSCCAPSPRRFTAEAV